MQTITGNIFRSILVLVFSLAFVHSGYALDTSFTKKHTGDFNGDSIEDALYQGGVNSSLSMLMTS